MAAMSEQWHLCFKLFPVRSVTGESIFGEIMRRTVNGETQYRRLTDSENDEWQDLKQSY
jgi:hypothetical protein